MAKRYSPNLERDYEDYIAEMEEDKDGEYVLFSDYEVALKEIEKYKQKSEVFDELKTFVSKFKP